MFGSLVGKLDIKPFYYCRKCATFWHADKLNSTGCPLCNIKVYHVPTMIEAFIKQVEKK